jgi:lysophospholipase L1-like esterase
MRRSLKPACLGVLATILSVVAVAACSGPAAQPKVTEYYLALGDSLSQGVQPDAAGASVETDQGYADQLYGTLLGKYPDAGLVKLGCPGETTATMINGGLCHYAQGAQLASATAFLRAHHGHIVLVTIDIGANDPENCANGSTLAEKAACVGTAVPAAVGNLNRIMTALRSAAGPETRIVGMSYYLPALADWRDGLADEAGVWGLEKATAAYNDALDRIYKNAGAKVADVFDAFDTSDFGNDSTLPGSGTVPRNVLLVCQWTWACTPPPRGPNQHPNETGYAVIARAFLSPSGLS